MRRPRPFYFFGRALRSLRSAPVPALVSAATVAIAVLLFGAFWLTARNVYAAVAGEGADASVVTIFAERALAPSTLERLERAVRRQPEVESVELIDPGEGLEELRQALGDEAGLLEGVDPGAVLPAVLSVRLRETYLGVAELPPLVRRLASLEGVESVEAESLWLERFSGVVRAARWLGGGWALLLGVGTLLVVSNTARLAALTRREEVEVLRLVGASDTFILLPFLWEGILQGAVGSAAGLGLLAGAFAVVRDAVSAEPLLAQWVGQLEFLPHAELAALAVAGPLVAGLGSFGAAARFLRRVPL